MTKYQPPGKIIEVSINELDFTPGPFCMSFIQDLSKLERSIHQIGLMHLPCVVKDNRGKLDIVTGYRRLKALHNVGENFVPCLDLTECKRSGLELLLFNFYENFSIRVFNDIEKGMILNRLHQYLGTDKILAHYMPLLGLQAYDEILEMYIHLDSYKNKFKAAIADGIISLKSVRLVNRMPVDDISELFNAIIKYKFNKNQQIRFIEYVQDLSIMKEEQIRHILSDPGLKEIMEKKDDNIPQKSRQLLNYLKSKRFPRLTEEENRFRAAVGRLNLSPGLRIKSDPAFEEKSLFLEILFEDGPDLIRKLESLKNYDELANIKGIKEE